MGLLSKLFGPKHMHVHLHVDGEITVTGIPQSSGGILKGDSKREQELTEQLAIMDPDLSSIQIPIVDFGSDIEDNNSENIDG